MKFTPERKAKLIVFLNALTLIGGVITIVLLLRVIGSAAKQNADTNGKIVASQKLTEKELGCLAAFFSQPNRQTLVITSLEKCQVTHTDTGQTEELKLVPVNSTSPAAPSTTIQNSATTSTQTPSNEAAKSEASQPAISQTTTPQVQVTADPQITIVPKELLGIPICVPFTGVCVR